MGQRRDNQGRFARRLFNPAAPTPAAPTPARAKAQPKRTPAAKLKYDPRVDAARLEKALDPNVGWFARRALRKDLERQFGKIDWNTTTTADPIEEAALPSDSMPATALDRTPGMGIETLRSFSGLTGNLWVRVSESGADQFQKVAESARIEVRPASDPEAEGPFVGHEHVAVFYGPISERRLPDDILFYPTSRS